MYWGPNIFKDQMNCDHLSLGTKCVWGPNEFGTQIAPLTYSLWIFVSDTQLWKFEGTALNSKRCPTKSFLQNTVGGSKTWRFTPIASGSNLVKIERINPVVALDIQRNCPSNGPNIFIRGINGKFS